LLPKLLVCEKNKEGVKMSDVNTKGAELLKHIALKSGSSLSEILEQDNKPYLDGQITEGNRKYHPYVFLPPSEINKFVGEINIPTSMPQYTPKGWIKGFAKIRYEMNADDQKEVFIECPSGNIDEFENWLKENFPSEMEDF
jgi:hypothetical protein